MGGGRGEQSAVACSTPVTQCSHLLLSGSAARLTASSCSSWGPTGMNSVPAQALKKEPVVADPSDSDPKSQVTIKIGSTGYQPDIDSPK